MHLWRRSRRRSSRASERCLILYQVFDTPAATLDRKIGLFLGLIACGAVAVGGYLTMQEEAGGERY